MISTIAWMFLFGTPAMGGEYTATCSCGGPKPEFAKYDKCTAAPVNVTIKSDGEDSSRIQASLERMCGPKLNNPGPCPTSKCIRTVSPFTPPLLGVGGPAAATGSAGSKDIPHQAGINEKHVDSLESYADENELTIIIRGTNEDSLPYQDQDGYRPKPATVKSIKTMKDGEFAGLLGIPAGEAPSEGQQEELQHLGGLGWSTDDNGVLRDPNGLAVFGDYDLQGVYRHNADGTIEPVDMNPASERLALNKAMDPNRTEPTQYLIQHGANDNFKRGETNANRHEQMQGRLPDPNEVYLVVNPDGTSRVVNTTAKLEEFYGAVPHATSGQPVNIKWPYGEY